MGPPNAPPYWFFCNKGFALWAAFRKKLFASSLELRMYSNASPCHWFVPLLLTPTTWLPMEKPYAAAKSEVIILYSLTPSPPRVLPALPGLRPSGVVVTAPSSVKLFDRGGAPFTLYDV